MLRRIVDQDPQAGQATRGRQPSRRSSKFGGRALANMTGLPLSSMVISLVSAGSVLHTPCVTNALTGAGDARAVQALQVLHCVTKGRSRGLHGASTRASGGLRHQRFGVVKNVWVTP